MELNERERKVLHEFREMLDANTICRIIGISGLDVIKLFKSNSIINEWLEEK